MASSAVDIRVRVAFMGAYGRALKVVIHDFHGFSGMMVENSAVMLEIYVPTADVVRFRKLRDWSLDDRRRRLKQ